MTTSNLDRREQLLDAVEACFARFGVEKTNLSDVAQEAGVSRQTVYRYFGDRSVLFQEIVLRTMRLFWQTLGEKLAHVDNLRDWLMEALLYCLAEVPRDPHHVLIRQLRSVDQGMDITLSDAGVAPVVAAFHRQFAQAKAQGLVKNGITEKDIAAWICRLIHSYSMFPSYPYDTGSKKLRNWLSSVAIASMFNDE